jgi:excisionase family DNA binding protein
MVANMTEDSTLIGTAEATEMLGVSKDTLIRMVARGTLKAAHKMSGTSGAYLFERADVEQLAREKTEAAS